jgi:glycosyltransferase involved in cell wall biosynthesis
VVASDTAPVREVVADGETGLLGDFFRPEEFAERALRLLDDPGTARGLGDRAAAHVRDRYSLEVCLPKFDALLRSRR